MLVIERTMTGERSGGQTQKLKLKSSLFQSGHMLVPRRYSSFDSSGHSSATALTGAGGVCYSHSGWLQVSSGARMSMEVGERSQPARHDRHG
ncbi:MAG: hypothetical protein HYU85_03435 [Chloroflexi bacterium]|nr:hypothetical protein [Chloroflexota bacterium]MBI3931196.1 hypothetical protein [Chloroflexota bacterium]